MLQTLLISERPSLKCTVSNIALDTALSWAKQVELTLERGTSRFSY